MRFSSGKKSPPSMRLSIKVVVADEDLWERGSGGPGLQDGDVDSWDKNWKMLLVHSYVIGFA